MTGTILYVASNIVLGVVSVVCLIWLFWLSRQMIAAQILLALLVIGSIVVFIGHVQTSENVSHSFYQWVFNMDEDRNIPAVFSALLWLIMGVLFASRGSIKNIPLLQRLFWWGLAVLMVFLAIDDYYAIHEILIYTWRGLYKQAVVVIGVIVLTGFFAWMWQDFKAYPASYVIMGIGGAMLVYSGLFLEEFMYAACKGSLKAVICGNYRITTAWEELFELLSIIIVIAGFMHYLHRIVNFTLWRRTIIALSVTCIVATIGFVAYMYPLPELERQLIAQPLDIQYGDELILRGYWVSNPEPQPGERVYILLYWQTPERALRSYRLSAHLLSNPDLESHAQADRIDIGQIGSRAWLPDMTVRGAVHLDVPEDIPTPGSYWVSVRLWYGGSIWDGRASQTNGLSITESHHPQMDEQTVYIMRLPLIPKSDAIPTLATVSDYQFVEGFTLAGYELPDSAVAGSLFDMAFHWQADRTIDLSLTQFIHLVGDDDTLIALDRVPFDERLLTDDWTANLNHDDRTQSRLPANMQAGIYQVYTGMYDPLTGQRIAVVDGNQEPIANNAIELGTIEIQAGE